MLSSPENSKPYIHRSATRYPVGVRVRSRELPAYQATSVDVSSEGIQLATASPVSVGKTMRLEIDLDDTRKAVSCLAIVRWSKITSPYKAGLEFTRIEPAQVRDLLSFLEVHETQSPAAQRPLLSFSAFTSESDLVVETEAWLENVVLEGDRLYLTLDTEDGQACWIFEQVELPQQEALSGQLSRLLIRPLEGERFEYQFIGHSGDLHLHLSAGKPYRQAAA